MDDLATGRGSKDLRRAAEAVAPYPEDPLRVGRYREPVPAEAVFPAADLARSQVVHAHAMSIAALHVLEPHEQRVVGAGLRLEHAVVGRAAAACLFVEQDLVGATGERAAHVHDVVFARPHQGAVDEVAARQCRRRACLDVVGGHRGTPARLARPGGRQHGVRIRVLGLEMGTDLGIDVVLACEEGLVVRVAQPRIVVDPHAPELLDAFRTSWRRRRPERGQRMRCPDVCRQAGGSQCRRAGPRSGHGGGEQVSALHSAEAARSAPRPGLKRRIQSTSADSPAASSPARMSANTSSRSSCPSL